MLCQRKSCPIPSDLKVDHWGQRLCLIHTSSSSHQHFLIFITVSDSCLDVAGFYTEEYRAKRRPEFCGTGPKDTVNLWINMHLLSFDLHKTIHLFYSLKQLELSFGSRGYTGWALHSVLGTSSLLKVNP